MDMVISARRLALAVTLAVLVSVPSGAGTGPEDGIDEPKVEFIEGAGLPCLQPVVKRSDADLSDFRAAERRWLEAKYPGSAVLEWKTELLLAPGVNGAEVPESVTVQRETTHVEGVNGTFAVVCFDIKLTKPGQPTP